MSKTVRIIISGSRKFNDYNIFSKNITNLISSITIKDDLSDPTDKIEIITGMAVGTDLMAIRYVYSNDNDRPGWNINLVPFEPKFWEYGEKAGEVRNKEMAIYASESDYCYLYAFWNCNNGGTKHMIDTAASYGITTYVYKVDNI